MFEKIKEKVKKQIEKSKKQKAEKVLKEIDKVMGEKERLKVEKKELKALRKESTEKTEEVKEFKIKIPFLKKKPTEETEEPSKKEPEKEEEATEEQEETKETEEEPKKKGLVGQLKELNEKIDIISDKKGQEKKLKKKKFKLPFQVKSQLKKLAVKDKVQVMLLQRTRNIKPVIGEIRDGMLMIKDMVYNGSVDSTWLWDGKIPTMIVPEWDLQPMTPEGIEEMKHTSTMSAQELMNYCIKFGRSAVPGKIIIRAIEAKQNQMLVGSKAGMKTIIITIVIVIIIMAVLFSGGLT